MGEAVKQKPADDVMANGARRGPCRYRPVGSNGQRKMPFSGRAERRVATRGGATRASTAAPTRVRLPEMCRWAHSIASVLTLAALAAGCGSARVTRTDRDNSRTAGSVTARTGEGAIPPPDVVRGCDRHRTGVGYGGVSKEAFRASLRVGPIALGSLREFQRWQLPAASAGQRRFYPIESIAVVDAGATVTLAVAPADRDRAGLIYDQNKFRPDGLYRIADMDDVVRFEACADPTFNHGYSQFDGGFVVAGRSCFSVDIYVDGHRYPRSAPADC